MKRQGRGALRPIQQGMGVVLLALCGSSALALGLGDIRVLSKPGQPLVAEIPVISNAPGELDNARAALAPPATFARVGLERPSGILDALQFQFAQDTHGHAVIRVTSTMPVEQKAIDFLIEVEWAQGRLVREYSALLDAPNTVAAAAAPQIQAPQAAAGHPIVRDRDRTAQAATSQPAAATLPVPSGKVLPAVRPGQTLSQIAVGLAGRNGYSLDQTMLALLRGNPEAFVGGNVNRLKQGAILRVPQQEALAGIGAAEAEAMVRDQAIQWRQARAPIPQPAQSGAAAHVASKRVTAAQAGIGHLEITPAAIKDASNTGAMPGTGAKSEADMAVNRQLQQAKEEIASRDVELQELRSRVAELEKLQQRQQQLIAMKQTDLAAAQHRLTQVPASEEGGFAPWLSGAAVLAIAAWWAARRRKPSPLPPLPGQRFERDASVLFAAPPVSAGERRQNVAAEAALEPADAHAAARNPLARASKQDVADAPVASADGQAHARDAVPVFPPIAESAHPAVAVPPQAGPAVMQSAVSADSAAARDRLELAIAYLDLGEKDTARSLLSEAVISGDEATRAQAMQLLDRLA